MDERGLVKKNASTEQAQLLLDRIYHVDFKPIEMTLEELRAAQEGRYPNPRIFQKGLNALKCIALRVGGEDRGDRPIMHPCGPVSSQMKYIGLHSEPSISRICNKYLSLSALFGLAILLFISGCAATAPGNSPKTAYTSETSGYPNILADKKAQTSNKLTRRILPAKLTSTSYFGRAPYICTPSGFGRTSGCFLRGS